MEQKEKTSAATSRIPLIIGIAVVVVVIIAVVVLMAGKGLAPQPTPTLPLPPPTNTALPPTATALPVPTATAVPTATKVPTPTATPELAVAADGIASWCLPSWIYAPQGAPADPLAVPDGAWIGFQDREMYRQLTPATRCTFIITFNQPVPAGMQLLFYDDNPGQAPFIKANLMPVAGNPNKVTATITHSYIVNPPFWDIVYNYAIVNGQGKELQKAKINIYKRLPERCIFDNSLPDPYTMWCPVNDS